LISFLERDFKIENALLKNHYCPVKEQRPLTSTSLTDCVVI
jgi:uncharacterized protein (UPF0305 family)